jgi:aspartyl-tRNA(Asn)/glutamyl-tRNA(Gln) amidotransferase subunit A
MQNNQPASESRRKFLRNLALSPVLANPTLMALGSNEFFPQPVESHRSVEAHVRRTIQQLSQEIRKKSISPVELTRDCLAGIDKVNPKLNAFITVLADSALADARRAEQEIHSGNYRGPLHGIPIGLKDLIDTAGTRTTAASAQFKDRIPEEDAEVVRRLRAAGAIILGKQNLHEFAYGGSSMISFFGEIHNPWDTSRVPGGSSGGSAASVAAGLGFAAIGTDTGGSVREPAAFCGIVGIKPTYGRVSARGVVPLSWSLDHIGPLTNSVEDAALLLDILAGYDPGDPSSIDVPAGDFASHLDRFPNKLRIGVPRAFFFDELHPDVAQATESAIKVFAGLHAEIRDVKLDVPADRTVLTSEAWAYHEPLVTRSPELYQPATLARIQSGANTSAAVALRARRALEARRHAIRAIFEEVDILLTPTTPIPPPTISDLKAHPDQLRPAELLMLRNTRPFNEWGIPAISVPCGFTKDGLPIGLQLAAAPWREDFVLQVAHAYEQTTEWHMKMPGRENRTILP